VGDGDTITFYPSADFCYDFRLDGGKGLTRGYLAYQGSCGSEGLG